MLRPSLRHALIALSLASAACGPDRTVDVEASERADQMIVGGSNAVAGQFAYQASIQSRWGSHFCGGSLIGNQWILTAAHCVEGDTAGNLRVVLGMLRQSQGGETFNVSEIVRHPGYDGDTMHHDVALLRLDRPASSHTKVALMNTANESTYAGPGALATVSGWGSLSSNGGSPDLLQHVAVPVITNGQCQQQYPNESIDAGMVCAGYVGTGGRDSCQGDSGGPLVVPVNGTYVQNGVVSWGYGCADRRYPGVYARVSSYASWIQNHVPDAQIVGGATPTPTPTPAPGDGNATGLAAATGEQLSFQVDVPAGATELRVVTSGGTGDADLYVRYGVAPTEGSWDCRPYANGNHEECVFPNPQEGTWHIGVRAYTAFTGVTLGTTITAPVPEPPPEPSTGGYVEQLDLSAAVGAELRYTIEIPEGAANLSFATSGGTGDADLYVRFGDAPTTTAYDCRPYDVGNDEQCDFASPQSGTWHVMVRAYSAFEGVDLVAAWD